ncbi:MAG: DUF418 domain-containing protein [Bryobacterales bacterium]|nr:DUF418 domain-containing protein [Bryobacterales bacterium]
MHPEHTAPTSALTITLPHDTAPTGARERIDSVDTIRGVALFGILLMNILSFGLPGNSYDNPAYAGGATGVNLWTWYIVSVLFEGKMRAMFSMLFGAGVVLMTSRADARGGSAAIADVWLRRCLWLMGFGLVHCYLVWDGDILFPYAVCGLAMYPFRKLAPRALIVLAFAILATNAPRTWFEVYDQRVLHADAQLAAQIEKIKFGKTKLPVTEDLKKAKESWDEKVKKNKPSQEEIQKQIREQRQGYWQILQRRTKSNNEGLPMWLFHGGIADAAGMMLFGMALMKLGVLTAERSPGFYLWMIAIGYGIGIPVRAASSWYQYQHQFDVWSWFPTGYTYDLSRLTIAAGHVGLVMLICRKDWLRWLTQRLAAVGQMALSNYLTHSLVCTTLFYGYGLAWFGWLERHQLYYVVLSLWVFQLIVSPIWLRYFLFGPFEWAWRSLTYWSPQPMRRP